jgi:hypothetical protein
MSKIGFVVLAVTCLMASYTARETVRELRTLLRVFRQAWAVGRLRSVMEICAVGLMAIGHGIYYWIMAGLLLFGAPVGH